MADLISPRSAAALLHLFPMARGRDDAASFLVDELVQAELYRRGHPDLVSGAAHLLALTQGSLLKEEYDLSTHGHADAWTLGAVLVDPLAFTVFNMEHGLQVGDAALAAMVQAMRAAVPGAKVVRIHTDGFAVLLGPTSEQRVNPSMEAPLRAALAQAVEAVAPGARLDFTLGYLELDVVDPPNWQVLGPLAWAELERALLIVKKTGSREVLRRRFELHGRLPELPR